ncbi:MAG: glucose-6-phosphate 1-dehydrogenase [Parcubacteria group bacterium Gr01-1014_20]|nr:MAG: glucose-6-phosphate 1-dehydrogenase [Parcubacteria group bacterium Gr01-1014_20]
MEKATRIPTSLIIFGATGDLSEKKLLPAIFDLYLKNLTPPKLKILGLSRRELTDEEFKNFTKEAIRVKRPGAKEEDLTEFLRTLSYLSGYFDQTKSYSAVGEKFLKFDEEFGECSNKLFYLAVPPAHYEKIFKKLAKTGLTIPCAGEGGWTRILVEKPFGNDLKNASKLEKILGRLFDETQIFRIDHYLAKETIQNILTFRFSNVLFEPIWNAQSIEKVELKFLEKNDASKRGEFYEEIGALRDVGQNHLLQMLAAITIENPESLSSSSLRNERTKILKAIKPIRGKDVDLYTARGQYQGFRKEKGVSPHSRVETYFLIKLFVENSRWKNVPFILESGKALKESLAEIAVYFKKTKTCLCPPNSDEKHQNILKFNIQPKEGITVKFWAKEPGFSFNLKPQILSFSYGHSKIKDKIPDAYERILYDCIRGDQTLFASTEEVRASWEFITPILESWHRSKLHTYKKGSAGPKVNLPI